MIQNFALVIAGLVLLVFAADWLTKGSAHLAKRFGVSPLFIGMTVVAFGTSAPEIFVTVAASIRDAADISIGNIVGSNISNIGLIIGTATLIQPIPISGTVYRAELPMFLLAALLLWLAAVDLQFVLWEGLVLTGLLVVFLSVTTVRVRNQRRRDKAKGKELDDEVDEEVKEILAGQSALWMDAMMILIGLAGLVLASELLVTNATVIAKEFGVREFVIAATVVALGTSLPELATSVVAARHGHSEIAVGNVLGSNIWNILAAMGLAGIIRPLNVGEQILVQDIPVMLFFTGLLAIILFYAKIIPRWMGLLFVMGYAAYNIQLYVGWS